MKKAQINLFAIGLIFVLLALVFGFASGFIYIGVKVILEQ